MSTLGSVSRWIELLDEGDPEASQQIWSRFYAQLVAYARVRLNGAPRITADEEDVVASAFDSFFRRVKEGQFPSMQNRDDLRQLLFKIVQRKAANHCRDSIRQKRGNGNVVGECDLDADVQLESLDKAASRELSAETLAIVHESIERLLGSLDDELREIALARLEGFTNVEIAGRIDRSVPTVERRLRLIRDTWQEVLDE